MAWFPRTAGIGPRQKKKLMTRFPRTRGDRPVSYEIGGAVGEVPPYTRG